MKRITIKDLAEMLNLSSSTVSRALSDHPDISAKTKARVKQAAETFNYRTNIGARLLRKQRSGLVALVLPEINMFFTPNLVKGVNEVVMSSKDRSLITFLSNDSFQKEKDIISQCLDWSVEGILISVSRETKNLDHFAPLLDAGVKCVLLDKSINHPHCKSLTIDSCKAAFDNVSNLIKNGHTEIVGVFDNPNLLITQERIKGYKKALREHDLPIDEENILTTNNSTDLDILLPQIINKNSNFTALFIMSDELLMRTLLILNKLGLSIPNDLSVSSISDGEYPLCIHPQITHTKDSGYKMGQVGVEFLLEMIDNPENFYNSKVIDTELVELGSVKKLSKNTLLKVVDI